MSTVVIETTQAQELPFTYVLSGAQTFTPETAFATFDGSGASGDFLACMSFLAQDGKRFMRVFPTTSVAGGDVADVTFAPFPGGIGQAATGPPEIPFCVVGFQVTVPASSTYTLMNGDLSFSVPNAYPAYFTLDPASGGLLFGQSGLFRFDSIWSAIKADFSGFAANPDLLQLGLTGDNHLIPNILSLTGFPTPSTGIGFVTWLPTATAGDAIPFFIVNADPANNIVVSCECNVWRLNGDAPE